MTACKVALSFLCALLLWASAARAQTQGEITGEVSDTSGAVIPGAVVVVSNQNTNVSRQVVTNGSGVFSWLAHDD